MTMNKTFNYIDDLKKKSKYVIFNNSKYYLFGYMVDDRDKYISVFKKADKKVFLYSECYKSIHHLTVYLDCSGNEYINITLPFPKKTKRFKLNDFKTDEV